MKVLGFLNTFVGQVVISIALFGLLAVVRTSRTSEYLAERETLKDIADQYRITTLRTKWNSAAYVPVSALSVKDHVSRQLHQIDLDGEQIEELGDVINGCLNYFSAPDFEDFIRYKTQSCSFSVEFDDDLNRRIAAKVRQGFLLPHAPEEQLRAVWETFHPARFGGQRAKIVAVAPDTIRIVVEKQTGSAPQTAARAARICTLAKSAVNPGIHISPGTAGQPANPNLFAELSFLARVNSAPNSGPVFVSFRWDSKNHVWLPIALYSDIGMWFECCL